MSYILFVNAQHRWCIGLLLHVVSKSPGISFDSHHLTQRRMAAEVNGSSAPVKEEDEPMDITVTHTENYQTLIAAGLPQKVAERLDKIFQTGKCKGRGLFSLLLDCIACYFLRHHNVYFCKLKKTINQRIPPWSAVWCKSRRVKEPVSVELIAV